MTSLDILIERWKSEGVHLLPPFDASIVRSVFLEAQSEAPNDVCRLKDPFMVARTLDEFFDKYVQDADRLLKRPAQWQVIE